MCMLLQFTGRSTDDIVEIIPGISAINAMAAWVQKPLSEGEETLVVVPAIYSKQEIKSHLVLMKAGKQFNKVYQVLKERGLEKNASLISRCGYNSVDSWPQIC